MAVLDRIATARDDVFAARVAMILMATANNVANEDPGTANHANRLALAQKVVRGEINNKAVAALVVASNATIQGAIDANPAGLGADVPDNDLEFQMATIYDNLANAYAAA